MSNDGDNGDYKENTEEKEELIRVQKGSDDRRALNIEAKKGGEISNHEKIKKYTSYTTIAVITSSSPCFRNVVVVWPSSLP